MRMLSKIILSAMCFVLLTSCGGPDKPAETSLSSQEIAAVIINSQNSDKQFFLEKPDGNLFDTYITGSYQIPEDYISDGAVCYLGGIEAAEIAVLKLSDPSHVEEVEDLFEVYLDNRAAAFNGYAPSQAAMAKDGKVESEGNYVALLICEYPAHAAEAFHDCFELGAGMDTDYDFAQQEELDSDDIGPEHLPYSSEDDAQPEHLPVTPEDTIEAKPLDLNAPEDSSDTKSSPDGKTSEQSSDLKPVQESGTDSEQKTEIKDSSEQVTTQESQTAAVDDNEYHPDLVLTAWQSGDSSQLGAKDRAILEAASSVISSKITDDMEPWEKELALHDWMIYNVEYDPEALSNLPTAIPDPDGDNPYGPLVNGVGVCGGYSSTFKLFMDMVGIPCVTVPGIANNGQAHAWNKVQLDGEWYCVDTTWDDPVDGDPWHVYFNVRDEHLKQIGFQWNNSGFPDANGTRYLYANLEVS